MAHGIIGPDLSIELKNNLKVCLYNGDIFSVPADGLAFTENGVIARKLDDETNKKFTKKLNQTKKLDNIYKMEACGGIIGFKKFLVAPIDLYSNYMSEKWKRDLEKLYGNVLQEAEREKFKSLTLSVFGTGLAGGRDGDCINILTKSLLHHKPRTLTKVNVVSKSLSIFSNMGNELAQHSQIQRVDEAGKRRNSSTNKKGDSSRKTSSRKTSRSREENDDPGNVRDSTPAVGKNMKKGQDNIEKNKKKHCKLINKPGYKTEEKSLYTNAARVNESETFRERGKTGSNSERKAKEQRHHDATDCEGTSVDSQVGEKNKFHSSGHTACSCSEKIPNCSQWNPDSERRQSDTDAAYRASTHLRKNRGKIGNDAGMNGCHYEEPGDSVRDGCHGIVTEDYDVDRTQRSGDQNWGKCPHCNSLQKISFEDHCGHDVCGDCIGNSRKCPDDPNQLPSHLRQLVNDSDSEDDGIQDVLVNDIPLKARCPICMDEVRNPKQLDQCGHVFCKGCIDDCFMVHKPVCPCCGAIYGILTGCQPTGTMVITRFYGSLCGYESDGKEHWEISYEFPSGHQKEGHPNPGKPYHGTKRVAYLPVTGEGTLVVKLLVVAFKRGLVFTIGRSTTSGREDSVTWNDIHHKTSKYGGPARFGYPDPGYLTRVREELRSKGVTEESTAGIRLGYFQTFHV